MRHPAHARLHHLARVPGHGPAPMARSPPRSSRPGPGNRAGHALALGTRALAHPHHPRTRSQAGSTGLGHGAAAHRASVQAAMSGPGDGRPRPAARKRSAAPEPTAGDGHILAAPAVLHTGAGRSGPGPAGVRPPAAWTAGDGTGTLMTGVVSGPGRGQAPATAGSAGHARLAPSTDPGSTGGPAPVRSGPGPAHLRGSPRPPRSPRHRRSPWKSPCRPVSSPLHP